MPDRCAINRSIPKINCFVLESCMVSPLRRSWIWRFSGSGTSSFVTRYGPIGANVSGVFPKSHCPPGRPSCQSRGGNVVTVQISRDVVPKRLLRECSAPVLPMTTTSSGFIIDLAWMWEGSSIGVSGPITALENLLKQTGSDVGTSAPAFLGVVQVIQPDADDFFWPWNWGQEATVRE